MFKKKFFGFVLVAAISLNMGVGVIAANGATASTANSDYARISTYYLDLYYNEDILPKKRQQNEKNSDDFYRILMGHHRAAIVSSKGNEKVKAKSNAKAFVTKYYKLTKDALTEAGKYKLLKQFPKGIDSL